MSQIDYNDFMRIVMDWGEAKARLAVASAGGAYRMDLEGQLRRRVDQLFRKICDEASRCFPSR